jgi:hypothetical protein
MPPSTSPTLGPGGNAGSFLRHKHVEQAQFALSVRFRSAEDFPRPLCTLAKGVGLPGVSLVFGAQGHIADDADANARLELRSANWRLI